MFFLHARLGENESGAERKKKILRRRLPAQHRFRYQIGSLFWEILRLRTQRTCASSLEKPRVGRELLALTFFEP